MLKKLIDFLYVVVRGGTKSFSDAEKELLSFVLDALPEKDRNVFGAQLSAVSLVQRWHPGRLVAAFYRKSERVPKLPYPGYEYCLAKVTYISKGKSKTTWIVLHDGRFMTFERNVPTSLADIESLVRVVLHPGGYSSVAVEIDAEEHGRSDV